MIIYEDKNSDKLDAILADVFRFLGVEVAFRPPSLRTRTKPSSKDRGKPVMEWVSRLLLSRFSSPWRRLYSSLMPLKPYEHNPDIVRAVANELLDDAEQLESILGRTLGQWSIFSYRGSGSAN